MKYLKKFNEEDEKTSDKKKKDKFKFDSIGTREGSDKQPKPLMNKNKKKTE